MSYKVVTIETHLTALGVQIADAKQKGTYAGQEKHWDDEVAKILKADCPICEHNVNTSNEFIENQRTSAQSIMNEVEKTLAQKELAPTDYQLIEQRPVAIQQCVTRISDDLKDLMTANLQYRAGWPALARGALSDAGKGIVDPFVATRAQQINGQAAIMAKKQRVGQYLLRVQEFVKQAAQRKGKGAVDVTSFTDDIKEITNKMTAGASEIKELQVKKHTVIENLKTLGKKKPWTPVDLQTAKSSMGEISANAKNARGKLKTLDILLDGLEKRGKAAGPGWKDQALKAVEGAKKPYKEAVTASKAFDDDEAKCLKIYKEHGGT